MKGSEVAAQYAVDFLSEPTQEELDGPVVSQIAAKNPRLAATVRGAKAATASAHNALADARKARVAAAREIHEAREAAKKSSAPSEE